VKEYNFKDGTPVEIIEKNGKIIIAPSHIFLTTGYIILLAFNMI